MYRRKHWFATMSCLGVGCFVCLCGSLWASSSPVLQVGKGWAATATGGTPCSYPSQTGSCNACVNNPQGTASSMCTDPEGANNKTWVCATYQGPFAPDCTATALQNCPGGRLIFAVPNCQGMGVNGGNCDEKWNTYSSFLHSGEQCL